MSLHPRPHPLTPLPLLLRRVQLSGCDASQSRENCALAASGPLSRVTAKGCTVHDSQASPVAAFGGAHVKLVGSCRVFGGRHASSVVAVGPGSRVMYGNGTALDKPVCAMDGGQVSQVS